MIACCMFGVKLLFEPMLTYSKLRLSIKENASPHVVCKMAVIFTSLNMLKRLGIWCWSTTMVIASKDVSRMAAWWGGVGVCIVIRLWSDNAASAIIVHLEWGPSNCNQALGQRCNFSYRRDCVIRSISQKVIIVYENGRRDFVVLEYT